MAERFVSELQRGTTRRQDKLLIHPFVHDTSILAGAIALVGSDRRTTDHCIRVLRTLIGHLVLRFA